MGKNRPFAGPDVEAEYFKVRQQLCTGVGEGSRTPERLLIRRIFTDVEENAGCFIRQMANRYYRDRQWAMQRSTAGTVSYIAIFGNCTEICYLAPLRLLIYDMIERDKNRRYYQSFGTLQVLRKCQSTINEEEKSYRVGPQRCRQTTLLKSSL